MNRRAVRGAAAVVVTMATLFGLATLRGAPNSVLADACGNDESPMCPVIDRADPAVFAGAPVAPSTVVLTGLSLRHVTRAVLEPSGAPLQVSVTDATHLTVIIPAADLPAGATVQIGLGIDGQDGNVALSPPLAVLDVGAAPPAGAPSLLPAPIASGEATASPAAAASTTPAGSNAPVGVAATTPGARPAAAGGTLLSSVLWILAGFGVGGIVVLVIAARTGLLREVPGFRDRPAAEFTPNDR